MVDSGGEGVSTRLGAATVGWFDLKQARSLSSRLYVYPAQKQLFGEARSV
jgi:hypothetical protein